MNLTIGTANFLRKYSYKNTIIPKNKLINIFNCLKENKIFYLDTAFAYDHFFKLGKFINFKEFKISTKINFKDCQKLNFEKKYQKIIKEKIKNNNIKNFHILFIHNFDDLNFADLIKINKLLIKLKKNHLIKKIGISVYNIPSIKKIKLIKDLNFIQAPLNIFDRRFLDKNFSLFLIKNGITLQARSIFLQGVLLEENKNLIIDKIKNSKVFNSYDSWFNSKNLTKLEACINFIKFAKVKSVVFGVENIVQLKNILYYFNNKSRLIFPKNIYTNQKNVIDPRRWPDKH